MRKMGYVQISRFNGNGVIVICFSQVVVTNTVPHDIQKMQCHKIKTVDVSLMLSEAMRRIHHQESMSKLFQNISLED